MPNAAAVALRLRPPQVVADVLVAAAAIAVDAAQWSRVDLHSSRVALIGRVVVTAMLAVLPLRRRFPEAVCIVLAAANAWEVVLIEAGERLVGTGAAVALALALYTLGAHRDVVRAGLLGGGTIAALSVLRAVAARPADVYISDPLLVSQAVLVVPLGLGVLMRMYRQVEKPTEREIELQRLSERETSRRMVLEERATIARDLHDSVAHHVNLVVIQAETGPDIVQRGNHDVLRVFGLIGDTGRRALAELDRTLALLRNESGALLAPPPGLDDIPRLVRDTTAQGLAIELTVHGARRPLDAGIELAAYRITQEALTNTIKHAGTVSARVLLEFTPDGLSVQVTDRGRGFDPAAPMPGCAGHGLPGMRERARINGGTLAIASAPDAGTAVSAWLPAPRQPT
jgi:signal transduction histidine kinase